MGQLHQVWALPQPVLMVGTMPGQAGPRFLHPWERVRPCVSAVPGALTMHFRAGVVVAVGTATSGYWVLAVGTVGDPAR